MHILLDMVYVSSGIRLLRSFSFLLSVIIFSSFVDTKAGNVRVAINLFQEVHRYGSTSELSAAYTEKKDDMPHVYGIAG
ncbi:receptor-like cytosolic serine/threonine-protein kinase RBK1 [Iris pallida]|uniref:Receptor-like cytosolic serine/threonine-protein kinase RBK1 n=1 Tax=Iris pallida TaxID=29817 RepID=A0AAX6HG24_IRIPA|nr:receptor-like cytosolic serine/threonine-protein kinase RBK1 [Iris pallida]